MSKKVLIISYYWPPAGGPGVQRWLKFVKYLPDFGVSPVVYVPENAHYPITDKDLERDIRQDIVILRKPIQEPYGWAKFLSKKATKDISSGMVPDKKKQTFLEKMLLYIRGNFFIPDARIGWVKPSVSYLADYLEQHKIDTVITTGPPHSLHLIGFQLQQRHPGLKWIADFRDPWTTIGYHKALKLSKKSARKHKQLEKDVLSKAHHIIVTSPTTKKEFEQLTSRPITVITNGYDIEFIEKPALDNKFSLAHIGSLLAERNPRVLWKAIAELIRENKEFREDFELKLAGNTSIHILETLKEFKLEAYVNNLGYLSHNAALREQRSSQVLLLIEIDSEETAGIIPGKLFEYMAAERPILGIGPDGADFAEIMKNTNSGIFCKYDEKDTIKSTLMGYYEKYRKDNLKMAAIGLQYYSRKKLTEKLAHILLSSDK